MMNPAIYWLAHQSAEIQLCAPVAAHKQIEEIAELPTATDPLNVRQKLQDSNLRTKNHKQSPWLNFVFKVQPSLCSTISTCFQQAVYLYSQLEFVSNFTCYSMKHNWFMN